MSKKKYRNTTIKIIAIFFSLVLWIYVMSEVNPKITREIQNVKVDLLNVESLEQTGLVLMGPDPNKVTVNIKLAGRRNDVLGITPEDIIAQADLSGYSEGEKKVPVDIRIPNKAELEDWTPKQVLFKFEKMVQKQLPITVKATGQASQGFTPGQGSAEPEFILVKGPRSWVNSVTEIVATVDVKNTNENFKTSVPVIAVDDNGDEVAAIVKEPSSVQVSMPILQVKTVAVEPQLEGNPLNRFMITKVTSEPGLVKIKGDKGIIANISSLKTLPVDINYISTNTRKEVPFALPEGVQVIDLAGNPVVNIEVEEIVEKTFEFSIDDVDLINVNNDYEIDKTSAPGKISITVNAVETIMDELTAEDIDPYLNLEGLKEGTYSLEINARKISGIEYVSLDPERIPITLRKPVTEDTQETDVSEDTEDSGQQ